MEIKRRITQAYFDCARIQYAPLINKLSLIIGVDATHSEELRVRADEELVKCMICYNGSSSLATFLYHRLSGVFRHMRDSEYRFRRIQGISPDLMSNLPGPECVLDHAIVVKECLGCLNPTEHYIITELFFNHKTVREIAVDSLIVSSTICRIKQKAINKMRQKHGVDS